MNGLPIFWTRMNVELLPMSSYTHTLRVLPLHFGRETVPSAWEVCKHCGTRARWYVYTHRRCQVSRLFLFISVTIASVFLRAGGGGGGGVMSTRQIVTTTTSETVWGGGVWNSAKWDTAKPGKLNQRRRRRPNITSALDQCLRFAESADTFLLTGI